MSMHTNYVAIPETLKYSLPPTDQSNNITFSDIHDGDEKNQNHNPTATMTTTKTGYEVRN